MTVSQIEKRLTALEAEVAALKHAPKVKNDWWNKIAGVFANDPLFEQAMKYARVEPEPRQVARRSSKNGALKKRRIAR